MTSPDISKHHEIIEADTHLVRTVTMKDDRDGFYLFEVEERQYDESECPECTGARARDHERTLDS